MHKVIVFILLFLTACKVQQPSDLHTDISKRTEKKNTVYHESYRLINDLVHTRLELRPDWDLMRMYGKATITLHPHFSPVDSVTLDARGMFIHNVRLIQPSGENSSLSYRYDSLQLHIILDKTYSRDQNFVITVEYTARPDEILHGGSAAITLDKGLYFINADGSDAEKPKELWTQGETQANSVWFPTIEDPQQKMTQEIYLTVDTHFETLSNGKLISSIVNGDSTRTDYWKQSLPHAPYLTMIAVGDFTIVNDQWRKIPLQYYVEHDYAQYAKMIFGNTPEMMEFFSNKFGVDFPWEKYAQIPVRDFVSGAMENTTAVVHLENMLQTPREYLDGNYEDYISHELAHHWFGDLVTCESWANITLNEGFANYSEYLWQEFKTGRDEADYLNQKDLNKYLYLAKTSDPDVIRFDYDDREEMYDHVSYEKGGRILHMLRKYMGDDAFFASIKYYLTEHSYSTAEVHDLRMAFEKISGEDLNWFFNQWYLNHGYPILNINYDYNDSTRTQHVTIEQLQDPGKAPIYKLPINIDLYVDSMVDRKKVIVDKERQTFHFTVASKPDLVNVDADKALLCTKRDNKPRSHYIYQYYHAPLYLDRYEAISKMGDDVKPGSDEEHMLLDALNDKFWNIRNAALKKADPLAEAKVPGLREKLEKLVYDDEKSFVRATALRILSKHYNDLLTQSLLVSSLKDSSYLVVETAFKQLIENNKPLAIQIASQLESESNADVLEEVAKLYADEDNPKYDSFFKRSVTDFKSRESKEVIEEYGKYLSRQSNDLRASGILFLDSLGRNARVPRLRLAAVKSLTDLQNNWNKYTSKTPSTQAIASPYTEDSLKKLIEEIKKAEKDDTLIKRYKQN